MIAVTLQLLALYASATHSSAAQGGGVARVRRRADTVDPDYGTDQLDAACKLVPIDGMFKVNAGDGGVGGGKLPPVLTKPVAGAGGEWVHLQIAVAAGTVDSGSKVSASVEGLGHATVRAVGYVNLTLPVPAGNNIGPASKPGLYPDPLVPLQGAGADTVQLQDHGGEGAPQVFWVSLEIPRSAAPGNHVGSFSASGCGDTARFSVQVSKWSLPLKPSQLTGSQFQSHDIAPFTSPACAAGRPRGSIPAGCYTPEIAMEFFASHAAQRSNTQVWFQLSDLPWAPSYTFDATRTSVTLNTTMNDVWWPKVLKLTGSDHWRMPFSDRIHSAPHAFLTNASWPFRVRETNGSVFTHSVPMFQGSTPGQLNKEFEGMFKVLFGSVMKYLDAQGWGDSGSWVQVIDEPDWPQPETLTNTLTLMKLYKSVDPRIKIYQTRWPDGGGADSDIAHTAAAISRGTTELRTVPSSCLPLLELVDWWCPHVCQWTTPGVPEDMTKLRAKRKGTGRPLHITVYDNGVPIIESPWERLRSQPLDVWISNSTLDGTLSWYSVNSYGMLDGVKDPYLAPYTTPRVYKNGTKYLSDPAGWGYLLWPLPPSRRHGGTWSPVESIRWVMTGAGLQDAEYLYALAAKSTPKSKALQEQARHLATHFPDGWNAGCYPKGPANWGDDGYAVDPGGEPDGSSVVNTWRLAMGAELSE